MLSSAECSAKCPQRAYRLHLPTYAAIGDVIEIGLNPGASLAPDTTTGLTGGKAIAWYGSSILQGGVASRPGQIATHVVC